MVGTFTSDKAEKPSSLAIDHVTVINPVGKAVQPDVTVLVADGRISAVAPAGALSVNGVTVVDGGGKFLIPGLWDAHAHPLTFSTSEFLQHYMQLYVASGITSIRDAGGCWEEQVKLRGALERGEQLGPRTFIGGLAVDGPEPVFPQWARAVEDAETGRKLVRESKSRGADFLKVYSLLPRDTFFAIMDEARQQGLRVAGHVPPSVTAWEASDAGQASFEHLWGVFEGCSSREDEILAAEVEAWKLGDASKVVRNGILLQCQALDTYDPSKAQAFFSRLAKNGTYIVPTMVILTISEGNFSVSDVNSSYIPASMRGYLDRTENLYFKPFSRQDYDMAHRVLLQGRKIISEARAAGVEFMAGTDTNLPGFNLHDELAELVLAGLSPQEALKAAVYNPAKFFGRADCMGTVGEGKLADMVLLDANPLQDISNVRKISGVVLRGQWLSRQTLDMMLTDIRVAAQQAN